MQRSHGDAERLILGEEEANVERFAARAGVSASENARMTLINKFLGPGKFGKIFPKAVPFRPSDEALINLGLAMRDAQFEDPTLNNSLIPAGFTYLGQFIDHDLTFDKTVGFPQIDDPELIEQARTPTLDLDSLYGLGPKLQPELYDPAAQLNGAMFKIGKTDAAPSSGGQGAPSIPGSMPHDLPRNGQTAIIGDPRNDENLLVAQTHLAFLKFHNRVMMNMPQSGGGKKSSKSKPIDKQLSFTKAKQLVTWHYQWIVLNDFVARITDPKVFADIRTNGRKFYKFSGRPFMPLEFSVAAYRLGHSMIRETYNYNRVFSTDPGALTVATLGLLFRFTGGGGNAPIPSNWIIDWRRFFPVGDPKLLNITRKIDTRLIPQLHQLPGFTPPEPNSLAVRNLLRGSRVGLPSGQDVAKIMSVKPMTPAELSLGTEGSIVRQHGFDKKSPLWFYILKEASVLGGGKRLGPVGSRIVGEVFVGLVEGDPNSFISKQPKWKPTLPAATPGNFTMADLLRIVNELNPIG